MVTIHGVTQSNVTSTPLKIEHLVMQVASCAPDRILISTDLSTFWLLCDSVRAGCTFPPLREDPMKLLPTFVGISRAILDLTCSPNMIINLLDPWANVYPCQP